MENMTAAVLTVSDSAAQGTRADASGPTVAEVLKQKGFAVIAARVVADDRGAIEPALKNPGHFSSWQLLLNIYLFSIRIYGDFCGYTDIARGVSLLMGFHLVENFRFPYFSIGIQDFWRRWHMSLSQWLRDYLYISLGGNRGGELKTYRNLMLTMVLGGLWHGANWSFVFWGTLHGGYLAIGRMTGAYFDRWMEATRKVGLYPVAAGVAMFLTFHMITFTWIFFVITDFHVAFEYIRGLFAFTYSPDSNRLRLFLYGLSVLLFIDLPESLTGRHNYLASQPWPLRAAMYACFLILLTCTWTKNYEPFIYFQF